MPAESESARISVKVHPGARCSEIISIINGIVSFNLKSPPEKGKANKELQDYLADLLHIGKSNIRIERGLTSHNKMVVISGVSLPHVYSTLQNKAKIK